MSIKVTKAIEYNSPKGYTIMPRISIMDTFFAIFGTDISTKKSLVFIYSSKFGDDVFTSTEVPQTSETQNVATQFALVPKDPSSKSTLVNLVYNTPCKEGEDYTELHQLESFDIQPLSLKIYSTLTEDEIKNLLTV